METEPVDCVIPARNEASTIAETLRAVRELPGIATIWVIDDGSLDHTGSLAKKEGAQVIRKRRSQGKGKALSLGVKRGRAPWILFLDGDLGEHAAKLKPLILQAEKSNLDCAIASPPLKVAGFGILQAFSRLGIALLTGRTLQTPLSGQRIFKRSLLPHLLPFPPGFGVEAAMDIKLIRSGFRVEEIPISFSHRHTHRTLRGFLHRARQTRDIAQVFLGALFSS